MKPIDRLDQYINYKGFSYNAFDKSIDASNGYIGKQIKKKASIGFDIIEKILSVYTDLSLIWWVTGVGEMLNEGFISNKIHSNNYSISNDIRDDRKNCKYYLSNYNFCKLCNEKENQIKSLEDIIQLLKDQLNEVKKDKELLRQLINQSRQTPTHASE